MPAGCFIYTVVKWSIQVALNTTSQAIHKIIEILFGSPRMNNRSCPYNVLVHLDPRGQIGLITLHIHVYNR